MGNKCTPKTEFIAGLKYTGLALGRKIARLKKLQEDNPDFNYRDDHNIQWSIKIIEGNIEELKQLGVSEK